MADCQRIFEELAHGILLYNSAFDGTYMVTKFLGGLKVDIWSAIALFRPKGIDTTSALALLQEAMGSDTDRAKLKTSREDSEYKVATLKAFHKKNGLCFKCGEKWGHNHKCPAHISLHVLES